MPKGAGEWKSDEGISASKLNANDALNIRDIRVGPGLGIQRNPGGSVSITLDERFQPWGIARAKLTTMPESDTPFVAGVTFWDGTNLGGYELFAKLLSPHSLNDDLYVCHPIGGTDQTDPNGDPVVWIEFDFKADVVVQLTSAIDSAGGKYNGTIYGGVMSDAGTGNLSLPDGLTSGQSCLVLNQDEQGQPTHWAIVGSSYNYAAGVYWGMSAETPPRPIVLISRAQYRIASPQAIVGSGSTADPATWDRKVETAGTDYGDVPLTITTQRIVWDGDAGILRGFTRTQTFATDGRLDSYSAETEVDIDTATACDS